MKKECENIWQCCYDYSICLSFPTCFGIIFKTNGWVKILTLKLRQTCENVHVLFDVICNLSFRTEWNSPTHKSIPWQCMKHSPLPTHAHAQLDINFQSQEHSLQQGSKEPCEQKIRRWNEKNSSWISVRNMSVPSLYFWKHFTWALRTNHFDLL